MLSSPVNSVSSCDFRLPEPLDSSDGLYQSLLHTSEESSETDMPRNRVLSGSPTGVDSLSLRGSTEHISTFLTEAQWISNRRNNIKEKLGSNPKTANPQKIKDAIDETNKRIETIEDYFKSNAVVSTDPKQIKKAVKLMKMHERLTKRVEQFEQLKILFKDNRQLRFIGFDGWGKHCEKDIPDLKTLSHGQNLGQYDSIIYYDCASKQVQVKKLEATIALKKQMVSGNIFFDENKPASFSGLEKTWAPKRSNLGRMKKVAVSAAAGSMAEAVRVPDGPDDVATAALQGLDGVVVAAIHGSIVFALNPFVQIGSKGLEDEYLEITAEVSDLKEAVQNKANALYNCLQGHYSKIDNKHYAFLKRNKAYTAQQVDQQLRKLINQLDPRLDQPLQKDIASLILEYRVLAKTLAATRKERSQVTWATIGMHGMELGMGLYATKAASRIIYAKTGSDLSQAGMNFAEAAAAPVMGASQLAMMMFAFKQFVEARASKREFESKIKMAAENELSVNMKNVLKQHGDMQYKMKAYPAGYLFFGQSQLAGVSIMNTLAHLFSLQAAALPTLWGGAIAGIGAIATVIATIRGAKLERQWEKYHQIIEDPNYKKSFLEGYKASNENSLLDPKYDIDDDFEKAFEDKSTDLNTLKKFKEELKSNLGETDRKNKLNDLNQMIEKLNESDFIAESRTSDKKTYLDKIKELGLEDEFSENLYAARRTEIRKKKFTPRFGSNPLNWYSNIRKRHKNLHTTGELEIDLFKCHQVRHTKSTYQPIAALKTLLKWSTYTDVPKAFIEQWNSHSSIAGKMGLTLFWMVKPYFAITRFITQQTWKLIYKGIFKGVLNNGYNMMVDPKWAYLNPNNNSYTTRQYQFKNTKDLSKMTVDQKRDIEQSALKTLINKLEVVLRTQQFYLAEAAMEYYVSDAKLKPKLSSSNLFLETYSEATALV